MKDSITEILLRDSENFSIIETVRNYSCSKINNYLDVKTLRQDTLYEKKHRKSKT